MPKPRSISFLDLAYQNPTFPHLGIESFRLSDLRQRADMEKYNSVLRLQFDALMLFTEGAGTHEIDFIRVPVHRGVVTHVRPGQVQLWRDLVEVEAHVVLFTPEFLLHEPMSGDQRMDARLLERAEAPNSVVFEGESLWPIQTTFEVIGWEYERTAGDRVSEAIMRYQLSALLLQLSREALKEGERLLASDGQDETFRRFRQAVEASFAKTRTVDDYARDIGVSTKTLMRACQQVGGVSPKQFIDARVALEAKRLLAHTHQPVFEVGMKLGFSEGTNFAKFFRRETGMLPVAFRARVQEPERTL